MSARETIVRCAREQLNDEYEWAHAGPDKFDCSGLLAYCYGQAGVSLSRSSYEQARSGRSIPRSQAQPGDILIYGNGSHVGMVTGPNESIHALNTDLDIRITKIDGANIGLPLTDVRSILPTDGADSPGSREPENQRPTGQRPEVVAGRPPDSESGSNPGTSTRPTRDRDRQKRREKDRQRRRRRKA